MGHPISGAAEELATMLAISPRSADHRLDTAVGLCDRELLWGALFEGRIDLSKANLIRDLLAEVPDPRREELELIAIDFGESHTGHQLRRKLLSLTCENDPDEALRKEAVDRRGVWVRPAGHGMADIHGYLSAEHAEVFLAALEKLAASPDCADPYEQGEARTADQRRADALVGFLGRHTTVAVTRGCGDQRRCPDRGQRLDPGIQTTRPDRLARSPGTCACPRTPAGGGWSPTRSPGELKAMGTVTYRIPAHLREAVKARDVTCRFPGCHARAEFFDCDHIVPHPAGATCSDNLAGLCRRHHRTKTFSAWRVHRDPDTATHDLIWTSPLGRTYRTTAHRYKQDE